MNTSSKIERYLQEQDLSEPAEGEEDFGSDDEIESLMIGLINSLDVNKLTDEQIALKNDIVAHLNRDNI